MYLPNSFAKLMKEPTHLRTVTEDIVHEGRTLLSSFFIQI
jgi:hypothetical protein